MSSLTCHDATEEYDDSIVPLQRRMSNLEKLTLNIAVEDRTAFVDGNKLDRDILAYMPRLDTFPFNIRTVMYNRNGVDLKTADDIKRTFTYDISCCVDYFTDETSRCHVYTLPFTMNRYNGVTDSFPGGIFPSVRTLSMLDTRPFELVVLFHRFSC